MPVGRVKYKVAKLLEITLSVYSQPFTKSTEVSSGSAVPRTFGIDTAHDSDCPFGRHELLCTCPDPLHRNMNVTGLEWR